MIALREKLTAVLGQFTPFMGWLPELKSRTTLRADLIAGITVALVLIPQSMAYAQLAGLPPYYGLYAAFLPPMVASIFGSSRQLATGPVAVVSLLTAAALEPIATAGGGSYVAYAILLALMVGLFQLSLGLLRLGVLVNFLSHPVVLGFTNAAAIIIATSQLSKIFGVTVEKAAHHYETVWRVIVAASQDTHMPTLIFGIAAFTIIVLLRRVSPKIPGVLIAVVVTTIISWAIGFEKVEEVKVDRFQSNSVKQVVANQIALRKQIKYREELVAKAEKALDKTVEKYGEESFRTLSAQHALNKQHLRIERRVQKSKAGLKSLKSYKFVRVTSGDDKVGRFLHENDVPKNAKTDGYTWSVTDMKKDGTLVVQAGGRVWCPLPEGLPAFHLPEFDLSIISQLMLSMIAIALIGFMEAVSIAKAMAARTRQRLDANQELVGQGLGNIFGSMFQSYATSGSFSRSAVNIGAGALTGFSAVVTTIVVTITLLWFTPLLYHLPQATLAAVIMVAVIGLINFKAITHIWKVRQSDGLVSMLTFVLTLAFAPHLENAIIIGVTLSLVIFLYQTMKPRMVVLARHPDGSLRDAELFNLELCPNISMVRFDGSLYFANTSYFEDKVLERSAQKPDLKYVIVDGQGINQIDATGEEMLNELVGRLGKAGIQVIFTQFKKQVMDVLWQSGFIQKWGNDHFFRRQDAALEYVWKQLGDDHEVDCPLNVVCSIEKAGTESKDDGGSASGGLRSLLPFGKGRPGSETA